MTPTTTRSSSSLAAACRPWARHQGRRDRRRPGLRVAGNALTQNIYMQSGDITIVPESGPSVTQLYAANNQYAAPIKFLLSGFEAGFWGGQALSIPDAVAGNTGAAHLDLNQSWNWSGLYAYQAVGTANGAIANFDYHNTISSARVDPYAAAGLQDQQCLRLVLFGFHRLAGRRHQSDPQSVERHGRRRYLDQALRPDRHAYGLHAHGARAPCTWRPRAPRWLRAPAPISSSSIRWSVSPARPRTWRRSMARR